MDLKNFPNLGTLDLILLSCHWSKSGVIPLKSVDLHRGKTIERTETGPMSVPAQTLMAKACKKEKANLKDSSRTDPALICKSRAIPLKAVVLILIPLEWCNSIASVELTSDSHSCEIRIRPAISYRCR